MIKIVEEKNANGYGLFDMSGNVTEWCWDVHPNFSNSRYVRGGSSYVGGKDYYFWLTYSHGSSPDNQSSYTGFRIVCSASN